MAEPEIFGTLFIHGVAAVFGSFATIGAYAVSNNTVLDADRSDSRFQQTPSKDGRSAYMLFFFLAPTVFGVMWGLVYGGSLSDKLHVYTSYAVAMLLGITANPVVLKLTGMSMSEIVTLLKKIFREAPEN